MDITEVTFPNTENLHHLDMKKQLVEHSKYGNIVPI